MNLTGAGTLLGLSFQLIWIEGSGAGNVMYCVQQVGIVGLMRWWQVSRAQGGMLAQEHGKVWVGQECGDR